MAKSNPIRRIVRFRQILRAWRAKATSSHPPDVPPGHVAICVGSSCRRFIVRATHLNHPVFRRLLSQVAEEYGFSNNPGPLVIPCDEKVFEETLRLVSQCDSAANSDLQRCSSVGAMSESRPVLFGFTA